MRVLFWAVVIFAVVMWLQHAKKSRIKNKQKNPGDDPFDGAEPIVRCRQCGLHVPASEAHTNAAGVQFCSEEHLKLHRPD